VLSLPVLAAIPMVRDVTLQRRRRLLALSGAVTATVVVAVAFAAWRFLR
jgi:hypothetical protein